MRSPEKDDAHTHTLKSARGKTERGLGLRIEWMSDEARVSEKHGKHGERSVDMRRMMV